ncbi:HET-domain-containing protein [Leucogyrophana mollusca]|uniref:HET-domain-containing protein n=1 Tax=Leucogyrophana mollusca TaxID=85980 RepID=A0ACB8BPS7_9AGAM|nr:HET-domain-containing protein [Leucogyrophana mollusca]
MRLLDTKSLKLEEPRYVQEYAVLSHVWGDEEVSFHDINKSLKGYQKIKRACAQAAKDGYQYLWVDTCCINKSSSAELSEAINSMYLWYKDSSVCYAYLEDVRSSEAVVHSSLRRSKWFKRGWTLQELIAPKTVVFFAGDWGEIGTKASLIDIIADITHVDTRVLLGTLPLTEVSVARKMSWASRRRTTRVEDRAYSLMGIFEVHMPLIYGEGENAFIRLQTEIMRTSNDQSLFAWGLLSADVHDFRTALFADSPRDFMFSDTINIISPTNFIRLFPSISSDTNYKSRFALTNSGVQISLPIKPTEGSCDESHLAILRCSRNSHPIGIRLRRSGDGSFERDRHELLVEVQKPYDQFAVREIVISYASHAIYATLPLLPAQYLDYSRGVVYIRSVQSPGGGFVKGNCIPIELTRPPTWWRLNVPETHAVEWNTTAPNSDLHCVLSYRNPTTREGFLVAMELRSGRLCVHVDVYQSMENMEDISLYFTRRPCSTDASASDWVSKPLWKGGRVMVTGRRPGSMLTRGRGFMYLVTVTISVSDVRGTRPTAAATLPSASELHDGSRRRAQT